MVSKTQDRDCFGELGNTQDRDCYVELDTR